MNLLPIVVLVLIAFGTGYFLIKGDFKFPKFNRDPQIRRLNGFPTVVDVTTDVDKQREVIKSMDDFKKFLSYVDKSGLVTLREAINFDKEYLIAVSSTTQGEDGLGLRIKKVYEDRVNSSLLVSVEQTKNPDNCQPTPRKTALIDVVAISKTDKQIDFEIVKKTNIQCPATEKSQ